MDVLLTAELEKLVHLKVQSGRYPSASEVVRQALQLLEERDQLRDLKLEELRKFVAIGIEQADGGELLDGPEAFQKAREQVAKKS